MSNVEGVIFCAVYAVILAATIAGTLWLVQRRKRSERFGSRRNTGDPAVEAQKRMYRGISNETARRWAAEDAAFNRMAAVIADGWKRGVSYGDVLRDCPDLTRLAVERDR